MSGDTTALDLGAWMAGLAERAVDLGMDWVDKKKGGVRGNAT